MGWGIIGDILGAAGQQFIGARIQDQFADRNAKEANIFARDMSNTSHQREVADLRAAGLNPILSANSGASTPQGASAGSPNIDIAKSISTAQQGRRLNEELKLMEGQIGLQKIQGIATAAAATKDTSSAKNTEMDTMLRGYMADALRKEGKVRSKQADWDSKTQDANNVNSQINKWLGTLGSAADLARPRNGIPIRGSQREKWKNADEMKEDKRQQQLNEAEKLFRRLP